MMPQEPVPEQGIIGHEVEEVEQLDATQTAKKPFKVITFLRKYGAGKLTKEDFAEYNEFDKNYNWAAGIRKVESSHSIGDGIVAIEGIAASSIPGTRQIIKAEATSERNGPSFTSRTFNASDISSQDGSHGDFTGNRLIDTIEDFKKFGQLLSYDDPFDTHEYITGTAISRNGENTGIKCDEDDMMQNPLNDRLASGDQSQVPGRD
ncbi:hypothetical protein B0O99DRAFT_713562 [Bisporella sp. PMI_857]|nr:hypothetical protein B0O99DRAFT_713562 [Bisporella sp. PMI_857]